MKKNRFKGQGLVEFALVLPVLFAILLGIAETALVIQGYLAVQHAAREAARFAITYQPPQGACMDLDGDSVLADGINDGPPPSGDSGDSQDVALAASGTSGDGYPYCPKGPSMPGANLNESDAAYYARRVMLIKMRAREAAAGLRIVDLYDLETTTRSYDVFKDYADEPGFFGVAVWGFKSFDLECGEDPWDGNECLDHPGIEGLPVRVLVQHNVEIIDPFYRLVAERVSVQASAEMINEGVVVGFADRPIPGFSDNPGADKPGENPGYYSLYLDPGYAENDLPDDASHTITAKASGEDVNDMKVYFYTSSTKDVVIAPANGNGDVDGGQVSFTIGNTSKKAGRTTITAWLDVDGGGDQDADEPWATASKDWVNPGTTKITLSPQEAQNTLPYERGHDFVAEVKDENGEPVVGRVSFSIGSSTGVGAFDYSGNKTKFTEKSTDANGVAVVTVYGNIAGTATITAWLDFTDDNVLAGKEPFTTSKKTWVAPGTPYITVSSYEVYPLTEIDVYVMDHESGTTYRLLWCEVSGSDVITVAHELGVDGGGDATAPFVVPEGSEGEYVLETHTGSAGCGDENLVARSDRVRVLGSRPNLEIVSLTVPGSICPETVFTMSATIRNNTKSVVADTFDVDFYPDPSETPPRSPVGKQKEWVAGMGAEDTETVNTAMWLPTIGRHVIAVRVDTSNYIEERDETDNWAVIRPIVGNVQSDNWRSPTSNAADTGGDGNGFELYPARAYANDTDYAANVNGNGDRHRYRGYGFNLPADSSVVSITVRLDSGVDNDACNNRFEVELSWDGGTSWTSAKSTGDIGAVFETKYLGGSSDDWGHVWSPAELSSANFRVRIKSVSSDCPTGYSAEDRDFYLDWVPVQVGYAVMPGGCGAGEDPPWADDPPSGLRICEQLFEAPGFEGNASTVFSYWHAGEPNAYLRQSIYTYGGSKMSMRLHDSLWYLPECHALSPYLYQEVTIPDLTEGYTNTTTHLTVRGNYLVEDSTANCSVPNVADGDDELYVQLRAGTENPSTRITTGIPQAGLGSNAYARTPTAPAAAYTRDELEYGVGGGRKGLLASFDPAAGLSVSAQAQVIESASFESDTFDGWTRTANGATIDRRDTSPPGPKHGTWYGRVYSFGSVTADPTLHKTISTVGFENIHVSYWREDSSLESGDLFIAEWSYDGGATWTTLESAGAVSSWTQGSFDLPQLADNNPSFVMRFRFVANGTDYFYLDHVVITGEPATPDCYAYTSSDVPKPIPGVGVITSDLSVAGGCTIADVNVTVNVTHTWVGDLKFTLNHLGTGVAVVDRPRYPFWGNGCGRADIFATLDDEASSPVEDQCASSGGPAIHGRFTPNNPLSGFDDANSGGLWQLRVDDLSSLGSGRLNGWSIKVCCKPLPVLGFSNAEYRVNEGAGMATITVTLSAVSPQAVTVSYAASGGTATAGADYTAVTSTLTFTPGVTVRTFQVPIVDDGEVNEGDETVNLSLFGASNANIGSNGAASLVITENDVVRADFSSPQYRVDENAGTATITVTLTVSGASVQTITVSYATADLSATAGEDYAQTVGSLTFAPGETAKAFQVPIADDAVYEGDETVELALSAAGGVDTGPNATLVIVENEPSVFGKWHPFSVDFSGQVSGGVEALFGQEVQVRFYATNDADQYGTWFYLDELGCEVCTEWNPPPHEEGTGSVGGQVRVLVGGIPKALQGVDVWIYSQDTQAFEHTVTIQDGTYKFYNLAPGTYTIYSEIWIGGELRFATTTVPVGAGQERTVNLFLL